jgi:hypothetical protein
MPRRLALLAALSGLALAGCDGLLDVDPPAQLTDEVVIDDAAGARAALVGAYNALLSGGYYGTDLVVLGDLSADNTAHTGTFDAYAGADANAMQANNGSVEGMWAAMYYAVGITNQILQKVPALADLGAAEKDQILGEAHFLRALHYHNLVRLWGPVPLVTAPPESPEEASQVTRAAVDDIYAQILADLAEAERLVTAAAPRTRATAGAVEALLARVHLYRGDWAAAEQKATEAADRGYTLAPVYGDLFVDQDTPEDVFKVICTLQEYNNFGYYFQTRREMRPTEDLAAAYEAGDLRAEWSIETDAQGRLVGNKWRDTEGAEDVHVIRFAEVLLTRAEAHARQGRLEEALADYNRVRERAGLAPHVLGQDVTTQDDVLAAIWHERRVEFAFEGDRWPDLVRTGRAEAVLGISANMTLYPIPQRELDVAPNLTQNPGY